MASTEAKRGVINSSLEGKLLGKTTVEPIFKEIVTLVSKKS